MADGVTVDNGGLTDYDVASDEVDVNAQGVKHVQYIKLVGGVNGNTEPLDGTTANGLDVDVTRLPSIPAGTNNIGDVDVLTLPALPAGTNNIGDVDVLTVPAPLSTTGGGTEATAQRVTIASDSTGVLSVDDNGGSLTVDGSVSITGAIPAGANNIGDVDVLTLPALPAGTNNIGDVDIASAPTGASSIQNQGTTAQDAAAANNPLQVAGSSETMADSAPTNRVSADGDVSRLSTTDGALYVVNTGPQTWSYHSDGSAALTDATVHAAPGAGLSLYVQTIVVSTGAATAMNVFFEEGAAKVLGPYYLEAVAGRGLVINFLTPKKITANTALTVTTSAAIAQAVDVTGFIAPG